MSTERGDVAERAADWLASYDSGDLTVRLSDLEPVAHEIIRDLLAVVRPAQDGGRLDGELWSFLRMVMAKGGSIGTEYAAGQMSYEHYSAHLDAEASYYAKLFRSMLAAAPRSEKKEGGK